MGRPNHNIPYFRIQTLNRGNFTDFFLGNPSNKNWMHIKKKHEPALYTNYGLEFGHLTFWLSPIYFVNIAIKVKGRRKYWLNTACFGLQGASITARDGKVWNTRVKCQLVRLELRQLACDSVCVMWHVLCSNHSCLVTSSAVCGVQAEATQHRQQLYVSW